MDDFGYNKVKNRLFLFGSLDEHGNFNELFDDSWEDIYVDLLKIRKINVFGIRSWINAVQSYKGKVVYRKCSITMVNWLNKTPKMLPENVLIESFLIPVLCNSCHNESESLVILEKHIDVKEQKIIEPFLCSNCNAKLEVDFKKNCYFNFLNWLMYDKKETEIQKLQSRKPLKTTARMQIVDADSNLKGTPVTVYTEDISEGGMFIITHIDFSVGDLINLDFNIWIDENCYPIKCKAEVRWIKRINLYDETHDGIGVQFKDLDKKYFHAIKDYIASFELIK